MERCSNGLPRSTILAWRWWSLAGRTRDLELPGHWTAPLRRSRSAVILRPLAGDGAMFGLHLRVTSSHPAIGRGLIIDDDKTIPDPARQSGRRDTTTSTVIVMMRRGDGIGIEVLPDALRGVRLQQDAPGRVAKVAGVACDTNNDLLLLDGLTRLRSLLDEAGQPTRACMWRHDSYIQSLDITGWSTTELNLHRSKLVDVSATIEMSSSARRLLAHLRTDMIRHRRVERFVRQAGFDLESIEPTPIAIARLVPVVHDATDRQSRRRATVDGGRSRPPRAGSGAGHRAAKRHRTAPNYWPRVGRHRSRTCANGCSIRATARRNRQPAGRHGGLTRA